MQSSITYSSACKTAWWWGETAPSTRWLEARGKTWCLLLAWTGCGSLELERLPPGGPPGGKPVGGNPATVKRQRQSGQARARDTLTRRPSSTSESWWWSAHEACAREAWATDTGGWTLQTHARASASRPADARARGHSSRRSTCARTSPQSSSGVRRWWSLNRAAHDCRTTNNRQTQRTLLFRLDHLASSPCAWST